jgi:microsomal epoxide hydrolase
MNFWLLLGFSGSPSRPIGPRKMSEFLNKLMINNLGYKNYFPNDF